jgi:hypothetical protein
LKSDVKAVGVMGAIYKDHTDKLPADLIWIAIRNDTQTE